MKTFDVIIIGAGAAGLMCAAQAGKRSRKVLVLDHANKAGKKILMSGGGRCNFTNLNVSEKNFISHNPHFCKSALRRYTSSDFIDLVKSYRIPFHEKTLGQLFCDNKSKDILNLLLNECAEAGVEIQLDTTISTIRKTETDTFQLNTDQEKFSCDSLVIATGGLSIPTMGASPFGYHIAEQFGIKVWPTRAGLVAFTLHDSDKESLSELSGISLNTNVKCNKQQFEEGLLFTHRGLSGPSMLQISSYWNAGDTLAINLLPGTNLSESLINNKKTSPTTKLQKALCQYLPKRLVQLWLGDHDEVLQHYSNKELHEVASSLTDWQIQPNNTEGYRTAEVTLGGVDCNAISSKTFEAKNTAGLYFIGEVLDVTGWLGGYNFQWAWASGFCAGSVC